jgi:tetratricopeptide (TPR) repeat protein
MKVSVRGFFRCLTPFFLLALTDQGLSQEVAGCGSLDNAFGPFDYRDPAARKQSLGLVETHHFTQDVEQLIRGADSGSLIGDLDYTLRAFPNHHRALSAVSRYELRGGRQWTNPAVRSAECYLQRALVFTPNDAIVRLLFGNHLLKSGKKDAAREQFDEALLLQPSDVEVNYNAGLLYLEVGDLARAKELADVAYAGGYPLPGLRRKLAEAEGKSGR